MNPVLACAAFVLSALLLQESRPQADTAEARPWFRDATASSGVRFDHDWGATSERHLPETMGAGAAIFDANEDGYLDLYFVQGGPFSPAEGEDLPTNRLYLNLGSSSKAGIQFVDATDKSGDAAHTGYGMAVSCGDANGDGHLDLFVTNFGADALLLGDGAGKFTDVTVSAGLGSADNLGRVNESWTAGSMFFDADGDGDQDLYVTGYLEIDVANPEWCGRKEEGWRSYCHPDQYDGLADRYFENQGDGKFLDRTLEAGLAGNTGKGLGVLAWDVDNDHDLDLYVANDSTENRLWINDGKGHFSDKTLRSGTGVNANGLTEAGMGIAVGDVNHDWKPDLLVTNFDDESNTLYVNGGKHSFRDRTVSSGLEAPSRLPVGFGVVLADFDHDSHLDLVVANGHIIHNIELYHDGKTHAQALQLFAGAGDSSFKQVVPVDAGDAFLERYVGRGLYTGDLDNDGDLDLVLTQCGGPAKILENLTPPGRGFVLRGLTPGSGIQINTATDDPPSRFLQVGRWPSYFGSCSGEAHITHGDFELEGLGFEDPRGKPAGASFFVRGSGVQWWRLDENGKYVPDLERSKSRAPK